MIYALKEKNVPKWKKFPQDFCIKFNFPFNSKIRDMVLNKINSSNIYTLKRTIVIQILMDVY